MEQITPEQLLFLAILVVALGLLVTERLRPDLVALLIVLALAYSRILSTDDALAGLKSEPAVVIACMFVLSGGLQTTRVSDIVGHAIGKLAGQALPRILAIVMPAVALASAFTHHVMITGVMLPITLAMARERHMRPSKLLMPMAIASSLGTTITILGAPSFLIASELLRQSGRSGLGVFSIAPIGLTLTAIGTLYMLLVGRLLLPSRRGLGSAAEDRRSDEYLTELRVLADSPLVGHTVDEGEQDPANPFTAVALVRGGRRMNGLARQVLEKGDVLLIHTTADGLATLRQEPGWELEPVMQYGEELPETVKPDAPGVHDQEAQLDKVQQAILGPRSRFDGRTVAEIDFKRRYRVLVLGIWRRSRLLPQELSKVRLCEGDVLVLQGSSEAFEAVGRRSQRPPARPV